MNRTAVSLALFRELNCVDTKGLLDKDKMCRHVLDCLGALQCLTEPIYGNTSADGPKMRIFWSSVALIAEGIREQNFFGSQTYELLQAYPDSSKTRDETNWLPVHWAAVIPFDGALLDTERLIDRNPSLCTQYHRNCGFSGGFTPAHLIAMQKRSPNMRLMERICRARKGVLRIPVRCSRSSSIENYYPLHLAAKFTDSLELILFLIRENPGALSVWARGYDSSPLDLALRRNCVSSDIVCAIAHATTDVRTVSDGIRTAIVQCNWTSLFILLVRYICIAERPYVELGHILRDACCMKSCCNLDIQSARIVELIVSACDSAASLPDRLGRIPACLAAQHSSADVLHILLCAYPDAALVTAMSEACRTGNNLLHFACFSNRRAGTIDYLCRHHPRLLAERESRGYTPLHLYLEESCSYDEGEIAAMLNVDPRVAELAVPESGSLPLHILLKNRQRSAVDTLDHCGASFIGCLTKLLQAYPQAVLHRENLSSETPYTYAKKKKLSDNILRLLLRAQPQVDRSELRRLNFAARRTALLLGIKGLCVCSYLGSQGSSGDSCGLISDTGATEYRHSFTDCQCHTACQQCSSGRRPRNIFAQLATVNYDLFRRTVSYL